MGSKTNTPPPPPPLRPSPKIMPQTPSSVHHVSLSEQVEVWIARICSEQNLDPPNEIARKKLSQLGQKNSIKILSKMAKSPIGHFSKLLMYIAKAPEFTMDPNSEKLSSRHTVREIKNGDTNGGIYNTSPHTIDGNLANSPQMVEQGTRGVIRKRWVQKRLDFGSPVKSNGIEKIQKDGNLANSLRENASREMLALGELEFRKAFLILNYLRGAKLEDHVSVDFIKSHMYENMHVFESTIWAKFGSKFVLETERINLKSSDWDSDKTYIYHCHVDLQGNPTFKGPKVENEKTHLQRVLGDENILQVKFEQVSEEKEFNFDNYCLYHILAEQGIMLGLRRYRFYVYKEGDKKEKNKNDDSSSVKCYFVRTESGWDMDNSPYVLSNLDLYKIRLPFMHVHTISVLPKYMARFSLILSKTVKLDIDLATVNVVDIGDIECKDENGNVVRDKNGEPSIHSDGTGFISEDLAMLCPPNIFKGKSNDIQMDKYESNGSTGLKRQRNDNSEAPLLMQVRLFYKGLAVKGTLLKNKRLPARTIYIRPSMIKVKEDPNITNIDSFNSLEIVTTSNKTKTINLSKMLIALLHYGGVPAEFFLDLLDKALNDIREGLHSSRGAFIAANNHSGMDEDSMVARMISCGIPINEPYLYWRLSQMLEGQRKSLKEGRIPIAECYYLMGSVDPTGTLGPNEVCVILENGQMSGEVLVYKHPGLHVGDIHVLQAKYVKEIENVVGNSKYAILFPTTGPRSLADEMANSDFDGDIYWISRNPELLKSFKQSKPWFPPNEDESKKVELAPKSLDGVEEGEREKMLFGQFLKRRFKPSYATGNASNYWLTYMDRLLTPGVSVSEKEPLERKINQLVDIYYDALDASKTGKEVKISPNLKPDSYPHFMGKENYYDSTSILGRIYDRVKLFEDGKEKSIEVWKLEVFEGARVPQPCFRKWESLYDEYLSEMRKICAQEESIPKGLVRDKMCRNLFLKYKEILYEAAEFDLSPRPQLDIYNESLAIYLIAYTKAETQGVKRCGFAWKVAGHALCRLFTVKMGESPMVVSPLFARQLLRH